MACRSWLARKTRRTCSSYAFRTRLRRDRPVGAARHRRSPPTRHHGGRRVTASAPSSPTTLPPRRRHHRQVPIRERFEIQIVDHEWGRARSWRSATSPDYNIAPLRGTLGRRRLPHDRARQPGGLRSYYLWCWDNPAPDRVIERLEIMPARAAVPRRRCHARPPRRIPVRPHAWTARPAARHRRRGRRSHAACSTSRSTAASPTYPQPAPDRRRPSRLRGGSDADPAPSAYASVAAIPSATARRAARRRGARAGALGRRRTRRARASGAGYASNSVDPGRNWVHVTVLDDADRAARALPRALPLARRACRTSRTATTSHVNSEPRHLAHRRRRRRAPRPDHLRLHRRRLPGLAAARRGARRRRARLRVRAAARRRVTIEPGQRELELRLRRMADMNAARLVSRRHARPLPVDAGRASASSRART